MVPRYLSSAGRETRRAIPSSFPPGRATDEAAPLPTDLFEHAAAALCGPGRPAGGYMIRTRHRFIGAAPRKRRRLDMPGICTPNSDSKACSSDAMPLALPSARTDARIFARVSVSAQQQRSDQPILVAGKARPPDARRQDFKRSILSAILQIATLKHSLSLQDRCLERIVRRIAAKPSAWSTPKSLGGAKGRTYRLGEPNEA